MTLLEVLAALAILSAFVAAGGTWLVTTTRAQMALSADSKASSALESAIDLIEDDLYESIPDSFDLNEGGNGFKVLTSHSVPGQQPGWAHVSWRIEAETGTLLRETQPIRHSDNVESRIALRDVASFTIEQVESTLRDEEDDRPVSWVIGIEMRGGSRSSYTWEGRSEK